jgi:hypothetical protein
MLYDLGDLREVSQIIEVIQKNIILDIDFTHLNNHL